MRAMRTGRTVLLAAISTLLAQSVTFGDFVILPPGLAAGVSPDGSTVLGDFGFNRLTDTVQAWTRGSGLQPLPNIPGPGATRDSTAGGKVVAAQVIGGVSSLNFRRAGTQAAVWSSQGLILLNSLGTLASPASIDTAPVKISSDGSVVVGYASTTSISNTLGSYPFQTDIPLNYPQQAVRWSRAPGADSYTMQLLGSFDPPDAPFTLSRATGVSADGSVIVGDAHDKDSLLPFRWTADDGMQALEPYAANELAVAPAVSADGSTIVGMRNKYRTAFRWTQKDGMQDLGSLPGFPESTTFYAASDVSADGAEVVGTWQSTGIFNAPGGEFIWDAQHGMRDLWGVFREIGYDVPASGPLAVFQQPHLTPDGRTVVGDTGLGGIIHPFIATLPEPTTATLLASVALAFVRRRR